jgi:glutamyl-tRNA synthetase
LWLRDIILKWALKNAIDHKGKALTKAVIAKAIGEKPDLRKNMQQLKTAVEEVVKTVNQLTNEQQKNKLRKHAPELLQEKITKERELPPLPKAEKGKVVTRLPPEPSGYMHLGHAMSFTINFLYAKRYDGKIWLRFEDTDPRKVYKKYYRNFKQGLHWLEIDWDYEKNNSDSMSQYYMYAKTLVKLGQAYACTCQVENLRKKRGEGLECVHRTRDVSTNLHELEYLLSGKDDGEKRVLRLKGDMKSQNKVMRDPVLLRTIRHRHPMTGDKYSVWPTYDFAVAIEDAVCNITHVLRSSEFVPREELQNRIRTLLGFRNPIFITYARFNFKGTPVSKRKIRALIAKGFVPSWNDPRLPTIDGIKRRGIVPKAIREFTVKYAALTHSRKEYDWNLLFPINRRLLDPNSKRYFFVSNPVKLSVKESPHRTVLLNNHPQEKMGQREINVNGEFYISKKDAETINKNQVIRLMGAYNVIIEKVNQMRVEASYHSEEIISKMPKIQWVTNENIKTNIQIPDMLFKNSHFNENSLTLLHGFAERAARNIVIGEIIQFERIGFCRLDSKNSSLNFILAHK